MEELDVFLDEVYHLKGEIRALRSELSVIYELNDILGDSGSLSETLDKTIRLISRLTKADACLIYLVDAKKQCLQLAASKISHPDLVGRLELKLGEGITGWVAANKVPVYLFESAYQDPRFVKIKDLEEDQFETFISYPFLLQGNCVGVVNIQDRKKRVYGETTLRLVRIIADRLGAVVDHIRLYEKFTRQYFQTTVLEKISKHLLKSPTETTELFQTIVKSVGELTHSKICSLMTLNSERKFLTIRATQYLDEAYVEKGPIPVDQSLSGLAVRKKRTLQFHDLAQQSMYHFPELVKKMGLSSLLCVPIVSHDQVFGVINSYKTRPEPFHADEVRWIEAIASQIALVLEKSELSNQAKNAQTTLEIHKIVARAKSLLMEKHHLNEKQAEALLAQKSAETCKPIQDVASELILEK